MFLAWNEIKKNKLRFGLVIGVLLLVAYLVFFLSGLANGLEDMNKAAIEKWDADAVVVTKESDMTLPQSHFKRDVFDDSNTKSAARIGLLSAVASLGEDTSGVVVFGIDADEFLMPEVIEGEPFQKENETIAADSLKDDGFKIGDEIKLSSSDERLTITGFTKNAKFNAAPVLYTDFKSFQKVNFGEAAEANEDRVNGFVIRANDLDKMNVDKELELVPTQTFIENLPGFVEQNLTLTLMIYFLFAISAFIVAIFLYVLTIQKVSIFGVLKAEGISSGYLARSVIAQTFILAFFGVLVGFGLTVLTGLFLPPAVPVAFDYLQMAGYGVALIAVSIIGALFSVRTIVKIDPLKAIGG